MGLDWCEGCAERVQKNLPEDWKEGDAIPDDVTVHRTAREIRRFVFIGAKHKQKRHYLDPERKGLFG